MWPGLNVWVDGTAGVGNGNHLQGDTVWLTQKEMAELFQRDQSVISRHINNVFKEGELDAESSMHFLHIANSDKPVAFYNLDVIISVGYRVNSHRGTQFRIWAIGTLRKYLVKGFVLNDARLEGSERNYFEAGYGGNGARRAATHSGAAETSGGRRWLTP